MNNELKEGFISMASRSIVVSTSDTIIIPEPTEEGVYDRAIDCYRHSYFNYFTDIIFNQKIAKLDAGISQIHNYLNSIRIDL